jgi:hypothetical protein
VDDNGETLFTLLEKIIRHVQQAEVIFVERWELTNGQTLIL